MINSAYAAFLALDEQDRRDLFDARAEELGTLGQYVEKDFWVALVLDTLFNGGIAGDHPQPLFRGGTSLSRVFGLIERFSEDIDITFCRPHAIFDGISDPEEAGSKKEIRRRVDALKERTGRYVSGQLRDDLSVAFNEFSCVLTPDDDPQTLHVAYPALFRAKGDYVAQQVTLEGGTLGAAAPNKPCSLEPYVNSIWNDGNLVVSGVNTIAAERTLWDKVYILHGWCCGYADEGRLPGDRNRLSRHCYDVARMAQSPVIESALADAELREDARSRREIYFPSGWTKIDKAVPGTLRLVPYDDLHEAVARDYEAMSGMIHGEAPPFDEIIDTLSALEARINAPQMTVGVDQIPSEGPER